jgi:cysteine desulfuration protein SufE
MDRVGQLGPGADPPGRGTVSGENTVSEPATAGPGTLNPRLREIADDFGSVPGRERLQLLLEFADELPSLPERYAGNRDLLEQVPECQSPLFLAVEVDAGDAVHLFFDAPREAPTTRGFAGILHAGLDGLSADEVLSTPGEFSSQLGLTDLVSPLRVRGLAAMLARIKRQVREKRS